MEARVHRHSFPNQAGNIKQQPQASCDNNHFVLALTMKTKACVKGCYKYTVRICNTTWHEQKKLTLTHYQKFNQIFYVNWYIVDRW